MKIRTHHFFEHGNCAQKFYFGAGAFPCSKVFCTLQALGTSPVSLGSLSTATTSDAACLNDSGSGFTRCDLGGNASGLRRQ